MQTGGQFPIIIRIALLNIGREKLMVEGVARGNQRTIEIQGLHIDPGAAFKAAGIKEKCGVLIIGWQLVPADPRNPPQAWMGVQGLLKLLAVTRLVRVALPDKNQRPPQSSRQPCELQGILGRFNPPDHDCGRFWKLAEERGRRAVPFPKFRKPIRDQTLLVRR